MMIVGRSRGRRARAARARQRARWRRSTRASPHWGNDHATHLSTRLLYWVTDLGDWPIVPLIGVPHPRSTSGGAPRAATCSRSCSSSTPATSCITNGIKDARRPRPADAQPDRRDARPVVPERPFLDGGLLLRGARADPGAAARRTRARAARGQRRRRSRWPSPSSRVLLDVHWLSDVIAGRHARLGLVRALRGRVRRPPPALRRAAGAGRGGDGDAGRSSPPHGPPGREGVISRKPGKPAA